MRVACGRSAHISVCGGVICLFKNVLSRLFAEKILLSELVVIMHK